MEPIVERALSYKPATACALMSIALLSGGFVAGCKKSYGPDVVATVNGQPIERSEVEKVYRDNLGNNKEQPTKEQADATRLGHPEAIDRRRNPAAGSKEDEPGGQR